MKQERCDHLQELRLILETDELFRSFSATNDVLTCTTRTETYFETICTFFDAQYTKILEFGTWHGASTLSWLESCPQAHIVCVDTWLGSWEHWLNTVPGSHFSWDMLKVRNGQTLFFEDFLSNVVLSKLQERTTPLRNTTTNAYELLSRLKIFFDVVYIDAAHDYESVFLDVEMASRLLKPGGILCGDDFTAWNSVREAVEQWCQIESQVLYHGQNGWIVLPRSHKRLGSLIEGLELIGFEKVSFSHHRSTPTTPSTQKNLTETSTLLMSSKRSSPNTLRRLVRQFLLTNYWVTQASDQYFRKFPNLVDWIRSVASRLFR
jgi:hypothetical protein